MSFEVMNKLYFYRKIWLFMKILCLEIYSTDTYIRYLTLPWLASSINLIKITHHKMCVQQPSSQPISIIFTCTTASHHQSVYYYIVAWLSDLSAGHVVWLYVASSYAMTYHPSIQWLTCIQIQWQKVIYQTILMHMDNAQVTA